MMTLVDKRSFSDLNLVEIFYQVNGVYPVFSHILVVYMGCIMLKLLSIFKLFLPWCYEENGLQRLLAIQKICKVYETWPFHKLSGKK